MTMLFAVGDHVFRWCSYLGVPFAYQEHGIVVAIDEEGKGNHDDVNSVANNGNGRSVVILNFDHQKGKNGNNNTGKEESIKHCTMTVQKIDPNKAEAEKWERVQYSQTKWEKRLGSRAGTCSPDNTDSVPVVMRRVRFLQANSETLLSSLQYDPHKRNGECIAVWCKTGVYKSLAGIAKMGETGINVESFTVAGGIAAQLAASALVPVLLPFMVAIDVGQSVISAKDLFTARKEWDERTHEWNELFFEKCMRKVLEPQ